MRLVIKNTHSSSPLVGDLIDPATGAVFARQTDARVGDDPAIWIPACDDTTRVVLNSATHNPTHEDPAAWLSSWSEKGWAAFDEQVRVASNAAQQHGAQLLIRPHAQGMLSDAVSTLSWCTRAGGQHQSLLLDPVGWLVPSMLRDLEDHLIRINELSESLIAHGRVACVLLRSFTPTTDDQLTPAPISQGKIDPGLLQRRLGGLAQLAPASAVLDQRDRALFS